MSTKFIGTAEDFSQRFVIIYKKFVDQAVGGEPTSKLAFSRFVGVAQGVMQNWEKGSIPLPKYLKIIHDKLGFDYGWLLTGEGEPFDAARDVGPSEREKVLADKIAELEAELREADRVNRNLTTRLFVDGVGDKSDATSIGNAADGQG